MKVENISLVEEIIIGDFVQKEASISNKGLQFAIKAVSQGLYKDIYGSIVRELTSNCIDAHRAANKVEEDIIILLNKNIEDNTYYIEFIDFGTGMTPEFMNSVYMNYFDSNKRDSDLLIGGFGVGSKSPLGYSHINEFYITTIVDNIEYKYMLYKTNTLPNLILLSKTTLETSCSNGTTVRLEMAKKDITLFCNAIKNQLLYFDNINVINKINTINFDCINNSKIYETDIFKTINPELNNNQHDINAIFKLHLIVNNVIYSIDYDIIYKTLLDKLKTNDLHYLFNNINQYDISTIFNKFKVGLKLDIKDVNVTLNRESIEYSDLSINNITDKMILLCQDVISKLDLKLESSIHINKSPDVNKLYYYTSNNIIEYRNISRVITTISRDYFEDIRFRNNIYNIQYIISDTKFFVKNFYKMLVIDNNIFYTRNFYRSSRSNLLYNTKVSIDVINSVFNASNFNNFAIYYVTEVLGTYTRLIDDYHPNNKVIQNTNLKSDRVFFNMVKKDYFKCKKLDSKELNFLIFTFIKDFIYDLTLTNRYFTELPLEHLNAEIAKKKIEIALKTKKTKEANKLLVASNNDDDILFKMTKLEKNIDSGRYIIRYLSGNLKNDSSIVGKAKYILYNNKINNSNIIKLFEFIAKEFIVKDDIFYLYNCAYSNHFKNIVVNEPLLRKKFANIKLIDINSLDDLMTIPEFQNKLKLIYTSAFLVYNIYHESNSKLSYAVINSKDYNPHAVRFKSNNSIDIASCYDYHKLTLLNKIKLLSQYHSNIISTTIDVMNNNDIIHSCIYNGVYKNIFTDVNKFKKTHKLLFDKIVYKKLYSDVSLFITNHYKYKLFIKFITDILDDYVIENVQKAYFNSNNKDAENFNTNLINKILYDFCKSINLSHLIKPVKLNSIINK